MAEYTPTTENVRDCYVYADQQYDGDVANPVRLAVAEFDRWLAEHDREVRQDERKRIAGAIWEDEQRCNAVLYGHQDLIGTPNYTHLSGRGVGLQRARDIAEEATR